MTWLRRIRPLLFLLGVALVLGSVFGARAMTAGGTDAKSNNPPPAGAKAAGPVVMGTVDTDTPYVHYGLPPVLQSGTVAEVYVKNGQEVKADEKLYTFDTTLQNRDLEFAHSAVAVAKTKVDAAKEEAKQHAQKVKVLKQEVTAVEQKQKWFEDQYNLVKGNLEKGLRSERTIPESEWPARLALEPALHKANVDYGVAVNEAKLKKAALGALEAADPEVLVRQAEAGQKQAEEAVKKAQAAIDLCTVRAGSAGTVEQVKISRGSTIGISTTQPALWVIPAGKRIVRGEIEADFAHRVGPELVDREVTIIDHTDPKLTYKGTVRRVADTFLPKRSESLLPNETRVLEVEVVVADPAPAGRPPLRIGQRVRVNLGQ